jgi:hypothetical protein
VTMQAADDLAYRIQRSGHDSRLLRCRHGSFRRRVEQHCRVPLFWLPVGV